MRMGTGGSDNISDRGEGAAAHNGETGRLPMLYLTRKVGESVIINDHIEVTVVDIRGKSIKLGFTFPPEASVLRRELYERIQAEKLSEAATGTDPAHPLRSLGKLGKP